MNRYAAEHPGLSDYSHAAIADALTDYYDTHGEARA